MGKGSKGGKKQAEAPKVEEAKPKPDAAQAEAGFMKALQREMGDVEITEASVREYIAKMTPEQRLRLQNEGKDLKQELLTNTDHKEELQVFRKEVNAKAEAAGLPVEKDGEHLGRKLLTHMRTSTDAPPYLLVLEAIASCSFLVKLAVAEVREGAPKAAPQQGQSAPLAAPQLGSCASPGRAWRLWAARHSQGRGRPTGRPATASGARANRLQSRPFHRL